MRVEGWLSWSKALDSKSSRPARVSRVRIPLPPPFNLAIDVITLLNSNPTYIFLLSIKSTSGLHKSIFCQLHLQHIFLKEIQKPLAEGVVSCLNSISLFITPYIYELRSCFQSKGAPQEQRYDVFWRPYGRCQQNARRSIDQGSRPRQGERTQDCSRM